LLQWNNTYDPAQVSCRTAFDIFMYCLTPANQLRNIYRTGMSSSCTHQFGDIHRCLQIKAMRVKDEAAARVMLLDTFKTTTSEDPANEMHVWTYRREPPSQFQQKQAVSSHSAEAMIE